VHSTFLEHSTIQEALCQHANGRSLTRSDSQGHSLCAAAIALAAAVEKSARKARESLGEAARAALRGAHKRGHEKQRAPCFGGARARERELATPASGEGWSHDACAQRLAAAAAPQMHGSNFCSRHASSALHQLTSPHSPPMKHLISLRSHALLSCFSRRRRRAPRGGQGFASRNCILKKRMTTKNYT
jgi:hypothetical protein